MTDRSSSHTLSLQCRCGASADHVQWGVIDEAQRPDLVELLKSGQLGRTTCPRCGRALFADEPVAVLRTGGTIHVLLVFAAHPLNESEITTIAGLDPPWLELPFEAAPIVLERDLDADIAEPAAARAEVAQRYGLAAGIAYRESLRVLIVGSDPHDVFGLLGELVDLDMAGFQRLLAAHPEYLSDDMQGSTERACVGFPEHAATMLAVRELMVHARTDPPAAWNAFSDTLARLQEELASVLPSIEQLEAARDAERLDEVIGRGPAVVDHARAIGAVLAAGDAAEIVADALLATPGPDRAEHVEEAVRLLSDAIDYADAEVQRAARMMQLAMAYIEHPGGDRRGNLDEAVLLLREAIRVVGDAEPWLLACIQTNLAYVLSLRESGDKVDNLTEGYRLCQAALTWRSPERDVVDWAFTQINLGMIIDNLAHLGRARHRDARRAWESVLPYARELPAHVLGTAQTNLARLDRLRPERAWTRGGRAQRLRASRERLAGELEALEIAGPLARGRALGELASIDAELGDRSSAIEHYQAALHELRPDLSPIDSEHVAITVAPLLSEDGRWQEAAAAWGDAVAASDIRFYERSSAIDRETQSRKRGNLSRWAAFAMARAGDSRRAVLTLEDGRTRELRLRLAADDEQLAALKAAAPQLHAEYEHALADVARADLVDDADVAAARHQRILGRIRSVPGLKRFGGQVSWSALAGAVAARQPLVYVNPTPWGTVLLTVPGDGPVRTRFLEVTSTEIMERLMLGLSEGDQVSPSYLAAAAGDGTGIDIGLDFTLGWVGELVAKPIAEELRAHSANGGAMVLSGLLGQFPVHVAPWSPATGKRTLADEFDITFAPSATLHATARRRAAERASSTVTPELVAIADPRDHRRALPAARAEVAAISQRFDRAHVAIGHEATASFLRDHAAAATHLHLACHASGAAFDFRASGLELADGDLPLTDLSRIGPLTSRVAVASACQTATPDANLADEEYSIAAILLAAGSASAIASLWPVDDLATAVLMTRFYEELLDGAGRSPSQALRRARVWLRDLARADIEAFIAAYPSLAGERARRRSVGHDAVPDRDPPFGDPSYWAAFIAMGA